MSQRAHANPCRGHYLWQDAYGWWRWTTSGPGGAANGAYRDQRIARERAEAACRSIGNEEARPDA